VVIRKGSSTTRAETASRPPSRPPALLVSPSPALATSLRHALRPASLRVEAVASAESALQRLASADFALLIVDGSGGVAARELADRLRALAHAEVVPVLFLLAETQGGEDVRAFAAVRGSEVIYWPNDPAVLRAKVSVLLRMGAENAGVRRLLVRAELERQAAGDALSIAAHEMREPVGVIAGYVSMIADGAVHPDGQGWEMVVDALVQKTSELQQLIEDLLLSSRAEADRLDPWLQPLPLSRLVAEACARAHPRALLAGSRVQAILPEEERWVAADERHVARILSNLLNNALNHCPAGSRVEVRVGGGPLDPFVEVVDDGPGIAPDMAEKIFERFTQVRPDGDGSPRRGSGLGLYICRKLAEAQGGSLALVESGPSTGSRFRLTLKAAGVPANG
jgi:signal transduction histidine kinase